MSPTDLPSANQWVPGSIPGNFRADFACWGRRISGVVPRGLTVLTIPMVAAIWCGRDVPTRFGGGNAAAASGASAPMKWAIRPGGPMPPGKNSGRDLAEASWHKDHGREDQGLLIACSQFAGGLPNRVVGGPRQVRDDGAADEEHWRERDRHHRRRADEWTVSSGLRQDASSSSPAGCSR